MRSLIASSRHVLTSQLMLKCKAAISKARRQVAAMIGAQPDEIFFTASGSESDHWAIWGARTSKAGSPDPAVTPHVVTSEIEHPAVLQYLRSLAKEVHALPLPPKEACMAHTFRCTALSVLLCPQTLSSGSVTSIIFNSMALSPGWQAHHNKRYCCVCYHTAGSGSSQPVVRTCNVHAIPVSHAGLHHVHSSWSG